MENLLLGMLNPLIKLHSVLMFQHKVLKEMILSGNNYLAHK